MGKRKHKPPKSELLRLGSKQKIRDSILEAFRSRQRSPGGGGAILVGGKRKKAAEGQTEGSRTEAGPSQRTISSSSSDDHARNKPPKELPANANKLKRLKTKAERDRVKNKQAERRQSSDYILRQNTNVMKQRNLERSPDAKRVCAFSNSRLTRQIGLFNTGKKSALVERNLNVPETVKKDTDDMVKKIIEESRKQYYGGMASEARSRVCEENKENTPASSRLSRDVMSSQTSLHSHHSVRSPFDDPLLPERVDVEEIARELTQDLREHPLLSGRNMAEEIQEELLKAMKRNFPTETPFGPWVQAVASSSEVRRQRTPSLRGAVASATVFRHTPTAANTSHCSDIAEFSKVQLVTAPSQSFIPASSHNHPERQINSVYKDDRLIPLGSTRNSNNLRDEGRSASNDRTSLESSTAGNLFSNLDTRTQDLSLRTQARGDVPSSSTDFNQLIDSVGRLVSVGTTGTEETNLPSHVREIPSLYPEPMRNTISERYQSHHTTTDMSTRTRGSLRLPSESLSSSQDRYSSGFLGHRLEDYNSALRQNKSRNIVPSFRKAEEDAWNDDCREIASQESAHDLSDPRMLLQFHDSAVRERDSQSQPSQPEVYVDTQHLESNDRQLPLEPLLRFDDMSAERPEHRSSRQRPIYGEALSTSPVFGSSRVLTSSEYLQPTRVKKGKKKDSAAAIWDSLVLHKPPSLEDDDSDDSPVLRWRPNKMY